MLKNSAVYQSEAFVSWAKRSAIPMPASHEEPLSDGAQAAMGRILEGKRFVFLGEPDHFIVEKYPFRLLLIQYLFERGWRHVGMETGRSVGWRVDRYLQTGDASDLNAGFDPPGPQDAAIHDKELEFLDRHEDSFHGRLRHISESRAPGTARLHYWGYDFDLGVPLASVRPIQGLLEGHAGRQVDGLLSALGKLQDLSTDEQLAQIATLQSNLTAEADLWAEGTFAELQSGLAFLHESVAAHLHRRFPGRVLSVWMLYGQGSLMTPKGPRTVRLRDDTVESLLARVGDRFLLPLSDVDPQARTILSHANVRLMGGYYASTDLTAQADALYFVRNVNAERREGD